MDSIVGKYKKWLLETSLLWFLLILVILIFIPFTACPFLGYCNLNQVILLEVLILSYLFIGIIPSSGYEKHQRKMQKVQKSWFYVVCYLHLIYATIFMAVFEVVVTIVDNVDNYGTIEVVLSVAIAFILSFIFDRFDTSLEIKRFIKL